MKRVWIIVTAFAILAILTTSLSFAEERVRGRVVAVQGTRIFVQPDEGSSRSFLITGKTLFLRSKEPSPTKKLLPGSLVKVVAKGGEAEAVFIEEVPK